MTSTTVAFDLVLIWNLNVYLLVFSLVPLNCNWYSLFKRAATTLILCLNSERVFLFPGQENQLVALIPYSDQRLRPRRT